MSADIGERQGFSTVDCSYVAGAGLVAPTIQGSHHPTKIRDSKSTTKPNDTDGMSVARQHYETRGVSRSAVGLLMASLRGSTKKQYSGYIRKVNHLQSPVGTVLDFLSERFGQGLTYSAINCARSVLSSYVFSWTERAGLPLVERDFPVTPKPKYTEDCDVRVVLAYRATLHPVDSRHSKHFRSVETCYVAVISIRPTRSDYSSDRHIPYGCN